MQRVTPQGLEREACPGSAFMKGLSLPETPSGLLRLLSKMEDLLKNSHCRVSLP